MSTTMNKKEPVLLVQPRNTKSGYAILLKYNCVPRKWHVEGRYGSRTHRIGDRIGLPLLQTSQTIKLITSLLKEEESSEKDKEDPNGKKNNRGSSKCKENDAEDPHHPSYSDLKELLSTSKLIYEIPTVSNRIPKHEKFDATMHPERVPMNFSSLLTNILQKCKNSLAPNSHNDQKLTQHSTAASSSSSAFKFAELFSGIGGFGIALEALGGECVFASEIAPLSVHTYCTNMKTTPPHGVAGDIWEVDTRNNIPYHDLLVGGFPCQPFSSLGIQPGLQDDKTTTGRTIQNNKNDKKRKRNNSKNNNDDDDRQMEPHDETESINNDGRGRGQLFTQIVRVLADCQPQAFLLENVPGLIHTDNGNALRTIVSALEDTGYHVCMEVCSSRGLTVQSRKRLYIVGLLREDRRRRSPSSNSGNDNYKSNEDTTSYRATADTSDKELKPDDATEQHQQQQHNRSAFQFPFIPDLGLRARHVLHTDQELTSSFVATGVPFVLSNNANGNNCSKHDTTATSDGDDQEDGSHTSKLISPLSSRPVEMYRLSDAQFDQLRNRSKSWKPAKLAWDDTTCDTIDSHYGVTVGKGNSQLVPSPAPFHPRRFTPRECARVMGFPESFQLGSYAEAAATSMAEDNDDEKAPSAMPVIANKRITTTKEFNTYIKEQYHMLGNAVCPPVIAALAGAILNRCHLSNIPAYQKENTTEDWVIKGLSCAIQLALDAIPTGRREQLEAELLSTLSSST